MNTEPGNGGLHYRPDIDGLRALAILLVVAYHAGVPGLGGGFVGVDVFFAISGYLIIALLQHELERSGRVDWMQFYARRVRRLLPSALLMVAVTLALGAWVLMPFGDRQELGKTAIAASAWISNFYFWRFSVDYFHPLSDRHALLHTWSLAIEEQFYLAVPVLFAVAAVFQRRYARSARRALMRALILLGGLSLALAVWGAMLHQEAAFYLMPTHAYELALGAIAALAPPPRPALSRFAAPVWFAALGLVLASAHLMSRKLAMPGAWALGPAAAAAVMMWLPSTRQPARLLHFVGLRPLAVLGKLSYAWYLWHWPLLVLYRLYLLRETTLGGEIGVCGLALAIAALNYRYLERPLRHRFAIGGAREARQMLGFGVLASATIAGGAGALGAHAHFVASQSQEYAAAAEAVVGWPRAPEACFGALPVSPPAPDLACALGDLGSGARVYLWGDSHADHLRPALEGALRKLGAGGVEQTLAGCPPLMNFPRATSWYVLPECHNFNHETLTRISASARERKTVAMIAAYWPRYTATPSLNRDIQRALRLLDWPQPPQAQTVRELGEALDTTLRALDAAGVPALLVASVPVMPYDPVPCIQRYNDARCAMRRGELEGHLLPFMKMLEAHAQAHAALVFDPVPALCEPSRCEPARGGRILYRDLGHLSVAGSEQLTAGLTLELARLLSRAKPDGNAEAHEKTR